MSRRAIIAAGLALAACGGAPPPAPRAPSAEGVQDEAAGVQLRVVRRPTEGRIWLSLWIDAGARDATPAEAAPLAAWVAAGDLDARVLADGIELSTPCTRDALESCLDRLAGALATREVDPEALADARRRLESARRASAAAGRRADALALEALTGGPVDPLASGETASEAEVASFLAGSFGRGRALLIAIGDVAPEALRDGVEARFAGVPLATEPRAARAAAPRRAVRVEVGDAHAAAVATWGASPGEAASLGARWVARLGGDASADVFPLREGAALLVRSAGPDAAERLVRTGALLTEERAAEADVAPADGPRALARWIGAAWIGGDDAARGGLGLGVVVDGGRGDDLDAEDPDRALADRRRAGAEALLEASAGAPALEGERGEDAADVRTEQGVRIAARRLPDAARVAIAVRFDGGPARETPPVHGVSAISARAAALGCPEVAAAELGESVLAMGARVSPLLDAEGWGILVEGPSARWASLAHLATRCAARSPGASAIEAARAAAIADARRRPLATEAAVALAPRAPGRVHPAGDVASLGALDPADLSRWRRTQVVAARARVGFAGAIPAGRAAEHLARLTRDWPLGTAREALPWDAAPEALTARARPEGPMAVVMWSAPGDAAAAARGFADAAARSLAAEPGIEVAWQAGGASDGRAWATVALRAEPDALDALPAHTARAVRTIAHGWDAIADAAAAEERERRAWEAAGPRSLAASLSRPAPRGDARATVRGLGGATPAFLVARPAR